MLEIAQQPSAIGFDPERIERVYRQLELWVHEDKIPGAGIAVSRHGRMLPAHVFGRQRPDLSAPAMPQDALFLVASLTKPLTATGVLILLERGQLALDDPVVEHVPEFARHGKDKVRVRHLLTHTSGLPDMLPQNERLRAEHQPLDVFIRDICELPLGFEPGTAVQYQSTGIAMLAEVVHRVSGRPLRDFLRDELFRPLGLRDTELGAPDDWWEGSPAKASRIAGVRLSDEMARTNWHWNTRYWLSFGAPWGGLITTPSEYAVICQMFLDALKGEGPTARLGKSGFGFAQGGAAGGKTKLILSAASARAMTSNQLVSIDGVPEGDRRSRPWGLGWRLNWPGHSANFGDLLGPRAFGHWGSTGTLAWVDPDSDAHLVLFTTQPQEPEGRFLARISNMVSAALV